MSYWKPEPPINPGDYYWRAYRNTRPLPVTVNYNHMGDLVMWLPGLLDAQNVDNCEGEWSSDTLPLPEDD